MNDTLDLGRAPRILFLAQDASLVRAQCAGRQLTPAEAGPLRNDISTDEITPVRIMSHYDGSLARFRKIERPSYGYFIDHSCDGIATLLILGGMGLSPYVRLDIALFALVGYLLMSIHVFLSARVLSEVRLSYVAFGPTELRFVLIGLTLFMMFAGDNARHVEGINGFDIAVGIAGALLVGLFIFQTRYTGRRLARMEPRG